MKHIRDKLISALEPLGYNVELQGSYSLEESIPDNFITYFIADSDVLATYNNKPCRIAYYLNINFYSRKMSLINTEPDKMIAALTEAGFVPDGLGYDAGLDKDTGHHGWLMDFIFIEDRSV